MKIIRSLKQLDLIFAIFLIAGLAAAVLLYVGVKNITYTSQVLNSGWQYSWAVESGASPSSLSRGIQADDWQDIALPGKPLRPKEVNTIWYRAELPISDRQEASLFFRSSQQTVKVYLNEGLIYSFGAEAADHKKTPPGSIWNTVELPPGYQGKTVYLELYSPFSQYAGYLGEVKFGSKSDLITEVITKNLISLGLGSVFIFIGLACLMIYYFGEKFEDALQGLGFATFFVGIYSIAESKITQFFIYAPHGWMYTAYAAIYLAPVGYCIFYERFFRDRDTSIYHWLKIVFLLFGISSLYLEFTNLVSIFTTVTIFHLLLIFSMLISAIFTIQSALKGNREASFFSVGFILLCLAGVYDILTIFHPKILFGEQRMTQWGMLAFVLVSAALIGGRMKKLYDVMAVDSRTNEMNYQGLFTNMVDACLYCKVLVDEQGQPCDFHILAVNKTFTEFWDIEKKMIGRRLSRIIPPLYEAKLQFMLDRMALQDKNLELDEPIQVGKLWCEVSAFCPIPGFICIILKDITANKEAEEQIRYQAYHDGVTGLYNRMFFEQEIQRLEQEGLSRISIISVDLDGLKIVNDTFGHVTGDLLLKDAAKILQSIVVNNESLARIGGDEFALILSGVDNKAALKIGDQIIRAIEEYNSQKPLITLSMSLGVATFNRRTDKNLYDVYKRADDNMYQYKMGQASSTKSVVIEMLLAALAKKDFAAEGHVERLISLAGEMAGKLNLAAAETRRLILLAKMHDLGKIGIPDDILFKPGKLSEAEFKIMKEHSKIGYSIANRIHELSQIASLIMHHHEHWDGRGYPDGLSGLKIPLECRILAILDAYDAMTCGRPYSRGMQKEEAVQELQRCAGTQFDPSFVKVFIELIHKSEPQELSN